KRFHLKAGIGGLVDIEFAAQLLQLKYGHHFPELRVPNTLAALRKLKQVGLIRNDQYETLRDGYEFLRLVENRLRAAFPYNTTSVARDPKNLKRMGRLLGRKLLTRYSPTHDFEDTYLRTTQRVRTVFEEISEVLLNTPERIVKL